MPIDERAAWDTGVVGEGSATERGRPERLNCAAGTGSAATDRTYSARMKRTVVGALAGFGALMVATLAAILGVNALREQRRTCWCEDDCWCKTSLGQHVRWWVPARYHKLRGVEPG
jgi:hypothetical protein